VYTLTECLHQAVMLALASLPVLIIGLNYWILCCHILSVKRAIIVVGMGVVWSVRQQMAAAVSQGKTPLQRVYSLAERSWS